MIPDLSKPVSMSFIIETIIVLLLITGIGVVLVNYKTKKIKKENK